ncbi:MAG: folylpolyglutamate synthase/dihydrofolate synthase family protein [Cyanobacteria bacterium P01_F01_bin.86]
MTVNPSDDAINNRLGKYARFGVHLGLERIQKLLKALGNPQNEVPIIHVAGTNGKGSVCAYLSSVLEQAGYRVGRYTSPHLVSWCERICINNMPIRPPDLLAIITHVESAITSSPTNGSPGTSASDIPTQFEVFTAAAWVYFAQQSVDIAVIEVGLGGRLDATNVVEEPLVSIITSLSREHWQRLGPTLADIAREKAGVLKTNRPAVIGPLPLEAAKIALDRAQALHCPLVCPAPSQPDEDGYAVYTAPNHSQFRYILPFPGGHQLTNSAIAIAALHCLREQGWQISDEAMQEGIATARWPGRLQWLTWQSPNKQPYGWLLDGAHNPAAAKVLRAYVDALTQPDLPAWIARTLPQPETFGLRTASVTWLMGMLTTKDHADVFQELLQPGDRLHVVPVPNHASMSPEDLAAIAVSVCPGLANCQTYGDLDAGLQGAIADPSELRILCGSLYLVGHFFQTQAPNILP